MTAASSSDLAAKLPAQLVRRVGARRRRRARRADGGLRPDRDGRSGHGDRGSRSRRRARLDDPRRLRRPSACRSGRRHDRRCAGEIRHLAGRARADARQDPARRFRLHALGRPEPILRGSSPQRRARLGPACEAVATLARRYRLAERRWDSPITADIARRSVAQWLDDERADPELRATATGLRGFFLADPGRAVAARPGRSVC